MRINENGRSEGCFRASPPREGEASRTSDIMGAPFIRVLSRMSGWELAWHKCLAASWGERAVRLAQCLAAKRREHAVPKAAEVIPPAHDDETSHERGTHMVGCKKVVESRMVPEQRLLSLDIQPFS